MTARRGTFAEWWAGPGGRWYRRDAAAGKAEATLDEMRASPIWRRDGESIVDWVVRTDDDPEDDEDGEDFEDEPEEAS